MPCNRQGNQVRIYSKKFGDFISTHDIHLADNSEINNHRSRSAPDYQVA